jgi:hypothetical protein
VIVGDRKSGEIDLKELAEIRGEYFNEFLREARARISSKGKKMHMNLNVEFLRPDPPPTRYLAYPWNIRFDWKKWIDEGFCDEATLRNYQFTPDFILQDEFSLGVISECEKRGIPINYNRYIQRTEKYMRELEKVRSDGRFQSFIVYEVSTFLKSDEAGGIIDKKPDLTDAIREKGKEWGIG